MEKLRILSRIALFASALAFVIQIAPVKARGDEDKGEGNRHRRVEITFTKWVLNGGAGPFMAGLTGGDVEGAFVGEVFVNVARTNPDIPSLNNIEVIYGVQADDPDRSFFSLIRGGSSLGKAQFDGRILAGWRIGAPVHAEWVSFPSPSADCPSPPPGAGTRCFVGTITIERADDDDDDD